MVAPPLLPKADSIMIMHTGVLEVSNILKDRCIDIPMYLAFVLTYLGKGSCLSSV